MGSNGDDGEAEPQLTGSATPPKRSRFPVALAATILPFLLCGSLVGGCFAFLRNWDEDCDARPSAEVVGDLPGAADVVSNESTGRTCSRDVVVRARDGDTLALEDALIRHFEGRGWTMTGSESAWSGYLPPVAGESAYSLYMSTSEVSSFSYPRTTTRPDERRIFISIEFSNSSQPPGTTLGGLAVTGRWLGAPRFFGDLVLVPAHDRVLGFDSASGDQRWTSEECDSPDWAGPIVNPTDAAVFFCRGFYTRLDVATGRVLWRYETPGNVDRTRTAGPTLLLQSTDAIRVIDLGTGQRLWSRNDMGDATATANRDGVYVANDAGVFAYDAATGTPRWSVPQGASDAWAGPDAVYARTNDHRVLRLDGVTGAIIWTSPPEESRLDWSVIVGESDHSVVLETRHEMDRFTVYDKETGARTWTLDPPNNGKALASVGGASIVITDFTAGTVTVTSDRTGEPRSKHAPCGDENAAISANRVAFIALEDGRLILRLVDA